MPTKVIDYAQLYEPWLAQKLLHQSQAKIRVCKWGRGSGKTFGVTNEVVHVYDTLNKEIRPSHLVPRIWILVVAPIYKQTTGLWLAMKHFIPDELIEHKSEDEKTLTLKGDCRIEVRSADDPEHLRNMHVDLIWITEAPRIQNLVWYRHLLPMLSEVWRARLAILEGTPRSTESYFEDYFDLGQPDHERYDPLEVESWHFTSYDSPHVDKETIDRHKENMPEALFAQEYMAETQADESAAFTNIDACIGGELEEPKTGYSYVLGADLAKTRDFTVLTIMDRTRRKVVAFKRLNKLDWVVQEDAIVDMSIQYNNAKVFLDSSGPGSPVYDHLKRRHLQIEPVNLHSAQTKDKLLTDLMIALQKETIKIPRIEKLVKELKICRRYRTETEYESIHAPEGEHDDCVISLSLALRGCYASTTQNIEMIRPRSYLPR